MNQEEISSIINQAINESWEKLNLSSCDITVLPDVIGGAKKLKVLNLRNNRLVSLPDNISELHSLIELDLVKNNFKILPECVTRLTNLERLALSDNQLEILPEKINKLTKLNTLSLSDNAFTVLPEAIFDLTNLKFLRLSGNRLTVLPEEIINLKNLTEIYISNNKISIFPEVINDLSNLTEIKFSDNQITILPETITKLKKLQRLSLNGNPLNDPPPEIINDGLQAIRKYFEARSRGAKELREARLLFVGSGGAGKTSLARCLMDPDKFELNKDEIITKGINIFKWKLNGGITLRLWDFGGQEMMRSPHQIFLSNRSLYLLVLDGRKGESADYWLRYIQMFSDSSPVIVVLNKIDEDHTYNINETELRFQFPFIQKFCRISLCTKEGVYELSKEIHSALNSVRLLKTKWPDSWKDAKERLEEMSCSKNKNYIKKSIFSKICDDAHVPLGERDTLLDYLHNLGILLHFSALHLENTKVLNPDWIINSIYKILHDPETSNNGGILKLDRANLKRILPEYSHDESLYIVDLMTMSEFELCFKISDNEILIPLLVPDNEPTVIQEILDGRNKVRFDFQYDFMPHSVFPRFVVRRNREIKEYKKKKLLWKEGVMLASDNGDVIALVKLNKFEKRIQISVIAEDGKRREYLAIIRNTIEGINSLFYNLKVKGCVVLNQNGMETEFLYDTLLDAEKAGIKEFPLKLESGKLGKISVARLLGSIQNREETMRILRYIKMEVIESRKDVAKLSGVISEEGGSIREILEENNLKLSQLNKILHKDPEAWNKSDKAIIKHMLGSIMIRPNIAGIGIDFNELIAGAAALLKNIIK